MTRYFQTGTRLLSVLTMIAGLFFVWALVGAFVSPAVVVKQQAARQLGFSVRTRFDYEVETREATTVWPAGTRLPAGAAIYFFKGRPVVHVTPTLELSSSGHAYLKGTLDVAVVLRAVGSNNVVAWSREQLKLPPASVDVTLENGQKEWSAPALSLDAEPLRALFEGIAREFGYGGLEHRVDLLVSFNGEGANSGGPQKVTFSQTLPIRFDTVGFVFPPKEKLSIGTEYDETITKEVQVTRSYLERLWDEWLQLALSAMCLGMVGVMRFRTRMYGPGILEQSAEHRKFRAWITKARVHVDPDSAVEIDSLEGLVELAVDMNKRVLFDRIELAYFVIDDRNTYCYQPRQTGARAAKRQAAASVAPETPVVEKDVDDQIISVEAENFTLDPWITEVQIKSVQDMVRLQKLAGRTLIRTSQGYHLLDGNVCFTYRINEEAPLADA